VLALLAQLPAPASPEASAWLLLSLAGLAASAASVVGLLVGLKKLRAPSEASVRIGPQPLEVRAASDYATKGEMSSLENRITAEIHQVHGRISGMRGEMTERIDRLEETLNEELRAQRKDTKTDIAGVHSRITDVLSAVCELKGRYEG
jgi:hypothetical protein